ncbi:short-chain dehydrogenase [Xylariales sp. PMI_506]|nr:short-chain dehydrogenase [Xylariales sp. PMI_506]
MGDTYRHFFPSKATFTDEHVPDEAGKVFIVTGSSGGLGKELAQILYQKNATVYIAARSETKALAAINDMKDSCPTSTGRLEYLHLDLSDLSTIKETANQFLQKESRLDVLWNNAGVMTPPSGSKTAQGYELQLGVNSIATFLFTRLLHPVLAATAQSAPKNSVRVVWVSSGSIGMAPKPAVDFNNMDYAQDESQMTKYQRSKAGNVLHAAEFARHTAGQGILSLSLDPGILKTDLQRTVPTPMRFILGLIASEPKNGAYTELFAGLSPSITEKDNGKWVAPFGFIAPVRSDLLDEDLGKKYWEWTEKQVTPYL